MVLLLAVATLLLSSQAFAYNCSDDVFEKFKDLAFVHDICKLDTLLEIYDVYRQYTKCDCAYARSIGNLLPFISGVEKLSAKLTTLPDCLDELLVPIKDTAEKLWDNFFDDRVGVIFLRLLERTKVVAAPALKGATSIFNPIAKGLAVVNKAINNNYQHTIKTAM